MLHKLLRVTVTRLGVLPVSHSFILFPFHLIGLQLMTEGDVTIPHSDYWSSWAEPEIHSTKSELINPGLDKARLDLKLVQSQKQLGHIRTETSCWLWVNVWSSANKRTVDQTPQFFNTLTLTEPSSDYCIGSTNEKKETFKPSESLLSSSFSTAVVAPSPPAPLCLLYFPVLFHSFSPPSL